MNAAENRSLHGLSPALPLTLLHCDVYGCACFTQWGFMFTKFSRTVAIECGRAEGGPSGARVLCQRASFVVRGAAYGNTRSTTRRTSSDLLHAPTWSGPASRAARQSE